MIRNVAALIIALLAVGPADAQFIWNGPFTGTTNWSAGTWSPSVPPTGGGASVILVFNQLGVGAYTADNNLGNPFVLDDLNFNSAGGGITVGSAASNTLQFATGSEINQNGIGWGILSSTATLTGTANIGGTNFGNLQISGGLSSSGGLNINRPQAQSFTGLVDLSGTNSYAGGVTLTAGNLRVGSTSALGSGTLTINGGTIGATAGSTISNAVNLLGADFVFSGFASPTFSGVISQGATPRGLTISSNTTNTLTLQGTNTYTGPTSSVINQRMSANGPVAGSLTMSGANGSANLSSGFTFSGGSNLSLLSAAAGANNNNRINDIAPVGISGGTLLITGQNAGATLENIGAFSGSGSVFTTVDATAAGNTGTTLQADSLTRNNRGQFLFRANSAAFGGPLGANVANLLFDTAPALVGGGGAAGTTNISIIPFAIGGITTASTGTELVTYGAANGVRPLAAAEYAGTIASGAINSNNTRITADNAVTAPSGINALVVGTGGAFTGSTSTLTLASGTMLNTAAITVPAAMTLSFGAAEGVVFNTATMTVDGVLEGANGLTKTGTSNLILNNVANNFFLSTLTINQGAIQFTDPTVIGSFFSIVVNGRSSTSTPSLTLSGAGNANVNKPMTVTDGFVRLQTGGGTLTYSGQITGAGGVLVNGGDVALTNTTNSYTGQTRVFLGNLLVSGDNVLGNGGGVDIGASTTSGLRLTGNWTTSRQINFSFDAQVDTNGFDWTVNSPVTGHIAAGILNKVGAGMWHLTQGGALGQSLTSGTTGTSFTVNIQAGELRATNPTGSATGTATVNINGTSILSGASGIAGATTIAATAFVRPGTGGTTIGSLNFGSTLALNGAYDVNGAGTTADRINVLGAVTLTGTSVLNLSGTFDAATTFNLMTFASLTGTFGTVNGQPGSHFLVYNPTSLQLVPVPEPTAILAVAGLGLIVGHRIRKRRNRSQTVQGTLESH